MTKQRSFGGEQAGGLSGSGLIEKRLKCWFACKMFATDMNEKVLNHSCYCGRLQ